MPITVQYSYCCLERLYKDKEIPAIYMKNNRQWTIGELNNDARVYARTIISRVHRCRVSKCGRYWDIPRVVVACASQKAPFHLKHAYCCCDLHHPHPTLFAAYPSQNNPQSIPQYPGEPHFAEGHCAEPHSAHKLLNAMDREGCPIQIGNIQFSNAYVVKDEIIKPYCATCKQTFPQLR